MIGRQTTREMFAATVLILGAASSTVTGQGMVTDRPDLTESGVAVPAGFLQFEGGATYSSLGTGLSPKMGAFLEVAVTVPESGTAPIVGHTGLVYGISNSFQLDLHAGIGLSDTAPDFFIGAGLARLVR